MLRELPTTLAVSVLQASAVPFSMQLPFLHQDHHTLAVQAAFPEITSQGSLSLDMSVLDTTAAVAALIAFPVLLQASHQAAQRIQISASKVTKDESLAASIPADMAANLDSFSSSEGNDLGTAPVDTGTTVPADTTHPVSDLDDNLKPLIVSLRSALQSQPELVDLSELAVSSELIASVLEPLASITGVRALSIVLSDLESHSVDFPGLLETSCACLTSLQLQLPPMGQQPRVRLVTHAKDQLSAVWDSICGLSKLRDLSVVIGDPQSKKEPGGTREGHKELSDLTQLSLLTRLCLAGESGQYKLAGLSTLTCLRVLRLRCFKFPDDDVQELVCGLKGLSSLVDVAVGCELMLKKVKAELCNAFRCMPSVTSIDLSIRPEERYSIVMFGGLSPDSVAAVGAVSQLRVLSLANSRIDKQTAVALKHALPALRCLKDFSIAGCCCQIQLRDIMQGLGALAGLEQLDLSHNLLLYAASETAATLRKLTNVQYVNLKRTRLGVEHVFDTVVGGLHGLSGLLKVDLSQNVSEDSGELHYHSILAAQEHQPGRNTGAEDCSADNLCSILVGLIQATDSLRCVLVDRIDLSGCSAGAFKLLQQCLEGATRNDCSRLKELCHVLDTV